MSDQAKDKETDLVFGTVEEALPNALFRVVLDGENESQIAYLAGKMRKFRIRVLVGDRVAILPEPYGGKGRITKRL
ncbi:translation initiation factor IF-1 [Candidatus Parcubacteria bacterium]|uniref:Translation initiation factor IF-1 n=1 Tax=Candidatus Kaiserbacteria bacterium CG10_big_fil_rev_8_21_14_0_10_47_16 TaxID=1974608 RepID=A0A2H0UEC9_9BACT|nr:translation initiation factor IF-1 [Candidatus Parcubacteria bacterium]PIR84773.1 MAG: translation initiation factor IF-1 [Candidatus Kaiserbacteria bacterium CG10_big_fil_rev_8_21_14_0_10_47_16]